MRSYVLRQGRLTQAQRRAIDELLPRFEVPAGDGPVDFEALFGRRAVVWLEIGFGNGMTLAGLAESRPDACFIGAEVHGPGVGHLLLEVEQRGLDNLRLLRGDGAIFLRERVAPASLHGVLILFPDPWHKKRHHKRRIIQPGFVELLADRLAPGGLLHLATDWADYGVSMVEVLAAEPRFELLLDTCEDAQRPEYRRRTRFETRGLRLGHQVRDLVYRRRDTG